MQPGQLFDPAETVTGDERPKVATTARVGFLAGMLATWALDGRKPSAAQLDYFHDVARDALRNASVESAMYARHPGAAPSITSTYPVS